MGTVFRWIFQPLCLWDLELIKRGAFRDLIYNEKSYSCKVKGLAVIFFLFSSGFVLILEQQKSPGTAL